MDVWRTRFYQVVVVAALCGASVWLLWRLRVVVLPALIGFLIAYALNPVVLKLRRHHVPGFVALSLPLAALVGVLLGLVAFIVPRVGAELARVSQSAPRRVQAALAWADPWWQDIFGQPLSAYVRADALGESLRGALGDILGGAGSVVGWVVASTRDVLLAVGSLVLVVVVAAFLINDYEHIIAGVRDLVPRRHVAPLTRLFRRIDATLRSFLRGELLLFALATGWFTAGLALLGVPFALLVGPFAALIYLVPYIGIAVGVVLALLMSLLGHPEWSQAFGVLGIFFGFYTFDILFVTPRVIGERVGLDPLVVLLGIIAGGELMGLIGVLLAIPTLAVARIVLAEVVKQYRRSATYLGGPTGAIGPSSSTLGDTTVAGPGAAHEEPTP